MTERVKKRKGLKIFLIILLTLVLIGALMLVLYYELPYRAVGNDREKLTTAKNLPRYPSPLRATSKRYMTILPDTAILPLWILTKYFRYSKALRAVTIFW